MKRVLGILMLFAHLVMGYGQSSYDTFQRQIDSLDKIQPRQEPIVKPLGCSFVIKVDNQEQFDNISDSITKAIDLGKKNIRVLIGRGLYRFHEDHIIRMNESAEDVSITITGKNVVLTSDNDFKTPFEDVWTELVSADALIEVVDEGQKLCFIPFENNISPRNYQHYTKVQVTQWYQAPTYNVHHIDARGVYFIAPGIERKNFLGKDEYNVNYDFLYHGDKPRFRLYDYTKERNYMASRFLALGGCKYRLIAVKGICFSGNKSGAGLITINNCGVQRLSISECMFDNIQSFVAGIYGSDNIVFDRNTVQNINGNGVHFSKGCNNVRVTRNVFENCGQGLLQSFCVYCGEADYYIADNFFRDFGYGAIGVGLWYGNEKSKYSGGIIEHNEICFSPKYFHNALKHMLMDSGTIYTWTQNDDVIIRYNYIHDYTGAADNRGVFCDDGASNVKIYGNVILNIPNSYSIDSRAIKDFGRGFRNNANNFMAQNIVDGAVRYMGCTGDNRHVVKGSNIRLSRDGVSPIVDKYEGLEVDQKDNVVMQYSVEGGKVNVPRKYKSVARKAGRR